jgi:NTP pyrophosphatase (non-canonical NTP hydrolase)
MHEVTLGLQKMTEQLREINVAKGWRPAEGGSGTNTFGDYIALAHSELSEALEAFRTHGLDDATIRFCGEETCPRFGKFVTATDCSRKPGRDGHRTMPGKPEGVGSELADVLIRLVDMADVFGIDLAAEYHRKVAYNATREYQHGGRSL